MDFRTFGIEKFYRPLSEVKQAIPIIFPITCDSFGQISFENEDRVYGSIFFSNDNTLEMFCIPYPDQITLCNTLMRSLSATKMPEEINHHFKVAPFKIENKCHVPNEIREGIIIDFSILRGDDELKEILKIINFYVSCLDNVDFLIGKLKNNYMSSELRH